MSSKPWVPCQVYRLCSDNPQQLMQIIVRAESPHLTETELCDQSLALLKTYTASGGELILDYNRLATFLNQEEVDFWQILSAQETLLDKLSNDEQIKVVVPTIEGQPEQTMQLHHQHQEQLHALSQKGIIFILPSAAGGQCQQELKHLNWFKQEVGTTILGVNTGGDRQNLLQKVQVSGCKRIHLMNAVSRRACSLMKVMTKAFKRPPRFSGSFAIE